MNVIEVHRRMIRGPRGESIPEVRKAEASAFSFDAALAGIQLCRRHVERHTAVRDAYRWQGLLLEHDFYEVELLPENDRVRYTILPAALSPALKAKPAKRGRRKSSTDPATGILFADEG